MTGEEAGWVVQLSGIFGDKYGLHVLMSYAVTVGVLFVLGAAIVVTNARARRELEGLDRERKQ